MFLQGVLPYLEKQSVFTEIETVAWEKLQKVFDKNACIFALMYIIGNSRKLNCKAKPLHWSFYRERSKFYFSLVSV